MSIKYFNVKNGLSTGNILLHASNSSVVASTFTGNIVATDSANLGAPGNITITGGSANYVLITDGAGNLSWAAQTGGGSSSYSNSNVANYLPTYTGNLTAGNLTISNTSNLGAVGNLTITGGNTGDVLTTNGSGVLSWSTPTTGSTTITVDSYTGNGVQVAFTLSTSPTNANYTVATIQGVVQPRSYYTVVGSTLTFSTAPPDTTVVEVTTFGGAGVSGGGGSSSALTWNIANSNITMSSNNGYFVDTSNAAKTMTLPTNAILGDTIRINDLAGTFGTNNLTVARNGHKIQGITDDLLVDVNQTSFGLVYSNSTYGWKVLEL